MLPKPENPPASFLKTTCSFTIPRPIPRNFMLPILAIILWHAAMSLAPVPKTSINKNNKPFTTKNKIRFAG